MKAALDALAAIGERGGRRTVAVLGEMLELGDTVGRGARRGGRARRASSGIDVVVTVGAAAGGDRRRRSSYAGLGGWAVPTAGREQATDWLRHNVGARDVVLVKASRGAALEHLADALVDAADRGRRRRPRNRKAGAPSR